MSTIMKESDVFKTNSPRRESHASITTRKWIRCKDGVDIYSMGKTKLLEIAREAGAAVKIDGTVLIDSEKLDMYLETFRLPGRVL